MQANGDCGSKAAKTLKAASGILRVRRGRESGNTHTKNLISSKGFNLKKRSADASPLISYTSVKSPLVVMGESVSHPGEIPWQVLLHSNVRKLKSPFSNQPLGDFCGGILRYNQSGNISINDSYK